MKLRLVLPALLAALAALLVAGCGGGDDDGSSDPASVAPPKTPLYIDVTVQPEGEAKANIDALAKKIAGVDDVGGLIVEELESSAEEEGEEVDFEKEIKPWLGDKAGFVYPEFDEGEFDSFWVAVQVTDAGAAESFIEEHAKSEEGPAEQDSYEGVDFWVEQDDGDASGVFDGLLVLADSETLFKEAVDASNGETLADESAYTDAVAGVPGDSVADVYVDIGGLLREAEADGEVDQSAKQFFESTGVELDEATAVASLIPRSDRIEIDISSDATGDEPPSGDASELLGTLPNGSVGAFASAEFGKRFSEGIDRVDREGIPGEVPPNQLKKTLKEAGIDLDEIGGSIGDAGLFVEGNSERSLAGALVLATEDATQAKNTVSNIGLFVRAADTPGVTAISENGASGFSVSSPDLGNQPLVVIAKGERIAIGYGLRAALTGIDAAGRTLAEDRVYEEAVSALGDTPITAYVDGSAALKLATALVSPGDSDFEEAKPYLAKIDYLALGSESSGDLAVAKLIAGIK
ncbi:MAG TPA: DUF3352 domain-containing protein [Solirubrobacterales bacterium]|nr:DUF3352 domain-containing protein [Solirubrobacterales bacterium]